MPASRQVTRAVNAVLDLAPRSGEVSLARLVDAVAEALDRPIKLEMAEPAPGVCGQWRQYADGTKVLIQQGLPTWERTLAHELGHLVLGHGGIPIVEAARDTAELASDDLIRYMLNQRTGCMGPSGQDAEQEAEDFAALLIYRLGRHAVRSVLDRPGPTRGGVWLTVWVIAGLLALATGVRIGWALVNKQSLVSAAMIIALGGLAVVAALNWQPLTLMLDTLLHWPNISVGLSQLALIASAAGSCVMITSRRIRTQPGSRTTNRVAAVRVCRGHRGRDAVVFFAAERQPEMSPQEYMRRNLGRRASLCPGWLPCFTCCSP